MYEKKTSNPDSAGISGLLFSCDTRYGCSADGGAGEHRVNDHGDAGGNDGANRTGHTLDTSRELR